jgi:hypothetical protein
MSGYNQQIHDGYESLVGKNVALIYPDLREKRGVLLEVDGSRCRFEFIEKTFGNKTFVSNEWIDMEGDYDMRPL